MKNMLKKMLGTTFALLLCFTTGCSSDSEDVAFSAPVVAPVDSISAVTTVSSWTEGDVVTESSITVTAKYANGTTKAITAGYTLSGDTTLKTGTNTITVTYSGKTTTLTITAKAKASGGEEEKTGTVSIEVTVDGRYKCPVCGTEYDTKTEAENCAHAAGCPAWEYTVTFKDAEGGTNTSVTKKVKNGNTLAQSDIPSWTKDGYELSWSSSEAGVTTASKITKDVTFTAVWT
ncbi:MAG: bacterial Ig-like domain-containing protein [Treponema sp.]|nr:bacterial Ig-like domain-containing protein [Treponema sp.]